MGFQLVIAQGSESGRQFAFDQSAVTIGRTPECDVILYDTGVSRRHARILEIGGAFFIEDMGSSNGTLVNGAKVERQLLHEGDAISLGPVVLDFRATELGPPEPAEEASGKSAHTRILSVAELKRSRNKGVALLPKGSTRQELEELAGKKTGTIPILRRPRVTSSPKAPRASAPEPPGEPTDPERQPLPEPADTTENGPVPQPAPLARSSRGRAISPAGRARLKRQGLRSQVALWWSEATSLVRGLVIACGAAAALALAIGLVYSMLPQEKPKLVEPVVLTLEATPYSFGLGEGVTFEHADHKTFEFEVKSPVQVMGIIHFQSKDIGNKEEVSVAVNGTDLAWLTPDTTDADEREYEVLVPASVISRAEMNTLTFDNVHNPPGRDTWRVWNVWLEISVLPEKDEAGLAADADEKLQKGELKWAQRDIGAPNRWEAYKHFREAWLTLEALPASARPATYLMARQRMLDARVELDHKCNSLLLQARTFYSLKQFNEARFALDHITDFFPSKNHPCQAKAELDRYNYGL